MNQTYSDRLNYNLAKSLDKRVTIQAYSTTSDGMGGIVEGWTDTATVWAGVTPRTTAEIGFGEGAAHELSHVVTVRFNPDFVDLEDARLIYKDRQFDVLSIRNPKEANRYLELFCREVKL